MIMEIQIQYIQFFVKISVGILLAEIVFIHNLELRKDEHLNL